MLGIIGYTDGTNLTNSGSIVSRPFFVAIANHTQVIFFLLFLYLCLPKMGLFYFFRRFGNLMKPGGSSVMSQGSKGTQPKKKGLIWSFIRNRFGLLSIPSDCLKRSVYLIFYFLNIKNCLVFIIIICF